MLEVEDIITGASVARGLATPVRTFGGARCARVIERAVTTVDAHTHDWPVLSLFVLGRCKRHHEAGVVDMRGPSAVLHPGGTAHSSVIGNSGFEQIDIQFDPSWLRGCDAALPNRPIKIWDMGAGAAAAGRLRNLWLAPASDEELLRVETATFLNWSRNEAAPRWAAEVRGRIEANETSPSRLAAAAGLSLPWFLQAYRSAFGEGLPQTLQRRRVEQAVTMFREGDLAGAQVAADANFYDQSHMVRIFRKVLGRTPTAVAAEQEQLRGRNIQP